MNPQKLSLSKRMLIGGIAALALLWAGSALAAPLYAPAISLSPNSGQPGSTTTVSGSGFTGGSGSILWDGAARDTVSIAADGTFSKSFIIPPGASAGPHTVTVCWGPAGPDLPCQGGEFAEDASATFTVVIPTNTPAPESDDPFGPVVTLPPSGDFNVQPQAIELTQGVRGDIPTRSAPGGDLVFVPDDAVHVANRQAVVRVYPWVEVDSGGSAPPLTARLYGSRGGSELPGSPLSPATYFLIPTPGQSVADMRANEALSWNFILPNSWVQAGSLDLVVEVNPPGADHQLECLGCDEDNTGYLSGNTFRVVQTEDIQVRIYMADFYYYDTDGTTVINFMPTYPEISTAVNGWIKRWPIDPARMRLSYFYTRISQNPPGVPAGAPVRQVSPPIPGAPQWDNQVYLDANPDLVIPGGILRPYAYIPLAFSPSSWMGCSGVAGEFGPPLFHAGACDSLFAHEAAHSISRVHAANAHGEAGNGSIDSAYPGSHGQVEANAYGFDVWDIRAYPPTAGGGHMHDFMSYGGPKWVSLYTWEGIAGIFGAADIEVGIDLGRDDYQMASANWTGAAQQPRVDALRLSGEIHEDGQVYVSTAYHLSLPEGAADYAGEGSYSLILLDAAGETLFRRMFEPTPHHEPGVFTFYEPVPVTAGVQRIAVEKDGALLASVPVSASAPEVSLTSPSEGEAWEASGERMLNWQGTDADGDTVWYRVDASPDGLKWHNLVAPTTLTQAFVNLATVPGSGENWTVRVQASDGVNVSSDEAGGISIAPKAPVPTIMLPLDGDFIAPGTPFGVMGQAFDYADGDLPEAALEWLVDGLQAATGESATLDGLDEGNHVLTLRATNGAGLSGEASANLLAAADTDGDRLPDSWEAENGLDPADPADAALDSDNDGLRNWEEFKHGSSPNSADSDGDGVTDAAEVSGGGDPADANSQPGPQAGAVLPIGPRGEPVNGEAAPQAGGPRLGTPLLAALTLALVGVIAVGLGLILWRGRRA